ncbi:hypothetical protein JCM16303_002792 [Sporobolomyces ruberrimus]
METGQNAAMDQGGSDQAKQTRIVPPLSFDNVTLNSQDPFSSPLAMTPSIPFPSSPTTSTPPFLRSSTSPLRSPRTSQDFSKRLSIASTASSTSGSTTSMVQRPHVLMRTRHTSLPAGVVQSRHQSIVGTPSANNRVKAMNRISVASVASFGSVEEEEEGEEGGESNQSSRTAPSSRTTSFSSTTAKGIRPKPRQYQQHARYSLPPPGSSSALPSFTSVLHHNNNPIRPGAGRAKERSSSPLRPKKEGKEVSEKERSKREERRLRIAEELRDTEKAYVSVLEEIDANYYQPLLRALPAVDPLARRASNRFSASTTSPNVSPRSSAYDPSPARSRSSTSDTSLSLSPNSSASASPSTAPSSPPALHDSTPPTTRTNEPILTRREINEVFSNFTDVLNLSHVMLITLNESVPERPTEPVSISSSTPSDPTREGSTTNGGSLETGEQLSSSGGTIESSGPGTPLETELSPPVSPFPSPLLTTACLEPPTRLQRRHVVPPPVRLGKTLLPIVPFLKQYSLFVANFSGSLARLSSLEREISPDGKPGGENRWKRFTAQTGSCASSQGSKIGLGGMLLNIVQRVPRYRLLLMELLEFTDEDHPDLRDLENAFKLVDSVATHLDSQIDSHTHDLTILNLQRCFSNLDFPLLSPGRRLLRSGSLRKINRGGKEQTRLFFLFNDLLLHAATIEGTSNWGLGISGAFVSVNEAMGQGQECTSCYRLVDKFELEDVTVIGTDEGQLKYGFEILSTMKSFAVYADSLESKTSWLDAVRDAKAALMSDRRTLQRATIFDSSSLPPSSESMTTKSDRRVSLPSPSKNPSSFLGETPIPRTPPRHVSLVPQLGTIPPTPAEELQGLNFPVTPSRPLPRSVSSPNPREPDPSPPTHTPRPSFTSSSPTSTKSRESPLTRRPSLRTRRWSELRPSDAVQAITSALLPSTSSTKTLEDLSTDEMEYKVIEAYHAPVWVPDSKVGKCMRCANGFGLWRRKHHCRLCGGIVCWACSTQYFIIPGSLLSSSSTSSSSSSSTSNSPPAPEDRLARSCDTCYTAVFDDPVPSSRFLGSATPAATFGRSTLQPCVDKTATLHRLSRIINPRQMPLFDELVPASGPLTQEGVSSSSASTRTSPTARGGGSPSLVEKKRRRRLTAVGTLQDLLAKQSLSP